MTAGPQIQQSPHWVPSERAVRQQGGGKIGNREIEGTESVVAIARDAQNSALPGARVCVPLKLAEPPLGKKVTT